MSASPLTEPSAWKQRLWRWVGCRLFAWSPHTAHKFRRRLLGYFGARLTGNVKIRRSVRLDRPWHLAAGHLTIFGDHAALRLACPVTIGERCVISQHAIVATEMLDPETGESVAAPVAIGDDCWIAADALVLPGRSVGAGTVVGARALVSDDLPDWTVAVGEPARGIKDRAFVNA